MQGNEKSQVAQCPLACISGLAFFADAADRRFGAACQPVAVFQAAAAMMARMKAGRSSGVRLVIKFLSTTAS